MSMVHGEIAEIYNLQKKGKPVGITTVFGGQAGSEGKGAIAAHLALKYEWAVAACTFMPNAGHTWEGNNGEKVIVSQLPIAAISETVKKLFIGAGSVINPDMLRSEIVGIEDHLHVEVSDRLVIHPRAMVVEQSDRDAEKKAISHIGSTTKGCGSAQCRKIMRGDDVCLARDHPFLGRFVKTGADEWINDVVNSGYGVLVEQSQGYDLDINHGYSYPHCTSRQTTPAQIVADLGLDGSLVTNNIAVLRTFPIRVGNPELEDGSRGYSGAYGSRELEWSNISGRAGRPVEERTTVTGRVRRIFDFDPARVAQMSRICRPHTIALTFADYISGNLYGMTTARYRQTCAGSLYELNQELGDFVFRLEQIVKRSTFNPLVKWIKTGPKEDHIIDL